MMQQTTSSRIQTVNFIVGFALLVMLFPHGDKLPDKPAGVRTSIEMISNKPTLRGFSGEAVVSL